MFTDHANKEILTKFLNCHWWNAYSGGDMGGGSSRFEKMSQQGR